MTWSRVLALTGLACPLLLLGVVLLMRSGVITFRDDFSGFRGLGFVITCAAVLTPIGVITSARALWLDRRSHLARAAAAVNVALAAFALFLFGTLRF